MSDTRRPSERMADAGLGVVRLAGRLGLGPDDELAEALPGAVAAALDERDAAVAEVARLRLEHAQVLGAALRGVCERDGLARDARREAARADAAEARLADLLRVCTNGPRSPHGGGILTIIDAVDDCITTANGSSYPFDAERIGTWRDELAAALAAAEEGEDDA